MSPLRIVTRRTVGYARNAYATAFAIAAFLAAAAAHFAFRLNAAEGGIIPVSTVWATSTAPLLPLLAALLGMDTWSDERRSGRLALFLTSPVPLVDVTIGKYLGTLFLTLSALATSLVASIGLLHVYAPACTLSVTAFSAAFVALAIQSALWCAVAIATSALFSNAAIAACATAALLVALPRGIWAALQAWSTNGSALYGDMPLNAHVVDLSSGIVAIGTILSYLLLSVFALFTANAFVERTRYVGRGAARTRAAITITLLLAGVFTGLSVVLVGRIDATFDLPVLGKATLSERTLGILAESHGDLTATCFLPRNDTRFRPIARTLRALSRASAAHSGARITSRFVDPTWDLGEAARLVRAGIQPGNVVFTYGRRRAIIPVSDGLSERLCASAILRLTMPPQHRHVRWTHGHGETSFDDYGPFGMSDIARELARDGYTNQSIDLAAETQIPSDCALIVIAGAREDFSRTETTRLDAYLKQGGRLLVLTDFNGASGLSTLLSGWGLNEVPRTSTAKTISGTDVVVSSLADHPLTAPLKGSQLILEKPVAFAPSAAVNAVHTADRISFSALAKAGTDSIAALVERGEDTGDDLGFRPTRIIAIGDSSFVMNAPLAAQANANRDFFLNAVAYLSGTDAMTSGGADGDRLATGMDRSARRRFAFVGSLVIPFAVLTLMALVALRRRHRS